MAVQFIVDISNEYSNMSLNTDDSIISIPDPGSISNSIDRLVIMIYQGTGSGIISNFSWLSSIPILWENNDEPRQFDGTVETGQAIKVELWKNEFVTTQWLAKYTRFTTVSPAVPTPPTSSGGQWGIANPSRQAEINSNTSNTVTWNVDTDGPLTLKVVDQAIANLDLEVTNPFSITDSIHNKLMIMVGENVLNSGQPIMLNINSGGLLLGNDNVFMYIDEHLNNSIGGSRGLTLVNQVLFFDAYFSPVPLDEFNGVQASSMTLIKTGQFGIIISSANSNPGGGGGG